MHEKESVVPLYPEEEITRFYSGKVRLIQKKEGYRFSINAALLADFIRIEPEQTLLELGTGCGIVPIFMWFRGKSFRKTVGIEIQKDLADIAFRNVQLNALEERIKIIHADFRQSHRLLQEEKFDIVISNPPYLKVGQGRLNPCIEKAVARHELKCTLEELVRAAINAVQRKGRFNLIYPTVRFDDLKDALATNSLFPIRKRFIRAREEAPPNLVLVEAGEKTCIRERNEDSTLTLYDKQGNYSRETAEILFDSAIQRVEISGDEQSQT